MVTYFLKCKQHDTYSKEVGRVPATKFDNYFHLILSFYDYNMHVEGSLPASLCIKLGTVFVICKISPAAC